MFTRINERGFIFAELAIGLPLIFMMLWSMGNLFSSTWTTCRSVIADFTLQMEVRDAMSRIVDDMRTAQHIVWDGKLEIDHYIAGNNEIVVSRAASGVPESRRPFFYYRSQNDDGQLCIYRQRQKYAKSDPITGGDLLSKTNVIQFSVNEEKTRLWSITIKARSEINGHEFKLVTRVYAGGAER